MKYEICIIYVTCIICTMCTICVIHMICICISIYVCMFMYVYGRAHLLWDLGVYEYGLCPQLIVDREHSDKLKDLGSIP